MKLFFADKSASVLADDQSVVLNRTRVALLATGDVKEVFSPDVADAIIIQEKNSFKNFRYVNELLKDPLVSKYASKFFTINDDDCATGLLKGLYTSLPAFRFDKNIHVAVPYMQFPNEMVFLNNHSTDDKPEVIATWRGNTKSNRLRTRMIDLLGSKPDVILQTTDSWLNHSDHEKTDYVNLIKNGCLSLCPSGWAPVSYRIYESMALGRCPVILADAFIPPLGPDWNSFALFYPEAKIQNLYEFLKANSGNYMNLGLTAKKSWETYFSSDKIAEYYSASLLSVLKSAPTMSNKEEFKRWNSIRLRWSNEWTIPQRLMNKARRVAANY
jgi:hypothetical protein